LLWANALDDDARHNAKRGQQQDKSKP